jgi:hypothetical protein
VKLPKFNLSLILKTAYMWFILHPAGNRWSKWPLLNNKELGVITRKGFQHIKKQPQHIGRNILQKTTATRN